jgi:hypothetical protein
MVKNTAVNPAFRSPADPGTPNLPRFADSGIFTATAQAAKWKAA